MQLCINLSNIIGEAVHGWMCPRAKILGVRARSEPTKSVPLQMTPYY